MFSQLDVMGLFVGHGEPVSVSRNEKGYSPHKTRLQKCHMENAGRKKKKKEKVTPALDREAAHPADEPRKK